MSGKKAEQRKKKAEKQAAAKRNEALTGLLLKGGGVLLVVLALGVFFQGLFLAPQTLQPDQISASDHVRGSPDAAHTLTVYADFQCPACLTETTLIARAWPQIADKVKLVFRHYPLDIHRNAFLAARYAEAAARQDSFWNMHDVLFSNQTLWSALADPTEVFDGYARELGLDVERLKADVELPEVRNKILADQRGGTRAGVRSTPALYLNGRPISNPRTASELVTLINRAAEAG
jgi:protein-disulfide isomerase